MKHKHNKLKRGSYVYRGFAIKMLGYYPPEQRVVWEARDDDGSAFAHGFSLSEVKTHIDESLTED